MSNPSRGGASAAHPLLLLTGGAVVISFAPVFVRLADVGPTVSAFYRLTFGGAVLWALVLVRGGIRPAGARHLALSAAAGALLAVDLWIWHRSILYVGPGLATILANFQVFFLAAVGILFLREPLTGRLATAIPLAVLGLFLLVGLHWNTLGARYQVGIALGVLAGVAYAAYLLMVRRAQGMARSSDAVVTVATLSVVAAVLLGLTAAFEGEGFGIPNLVTWGALLGLAFGPQVSGWVMISTALPRVPASRAGLILLLQPSLAFVWDMLFFGRPTTVVEGAGAALALGAIYLGGRGKRVSGER